MQEDGMRQDLFPETRVPGLNDSGLNINDLGLESIVQGE